MSHRTCSASGCLECDSAHTNALDIQQLSPNGVVKQSRPPCTVTSLFTHCLLYQLCKHAINSNKSTHKMQQFQHVYYLTFMCGSTCFGRPSAHHQERTTALETSGFTVGAWRLERCWSWSGPGHGQQCSNRHAPTVKPEVSSAVVRS